MTERRRVAAWPLAAGALAVYLAMWLGYRQGWGWLDSVDRSLLSAAYDIGIKHPAWVRFWDLVCTVFAPSTFRLLGMLAAVVTAVRRQLRATLFVLVSVELSGLVSQAAKGLADRPRPETALVAASSTSFPSGHAVGVMVGVAALLTVLLPMLSRPVRAVAVAAGVLLVIAVGVGRVALNVHHPSDVLAGWALGYLYFLVCARLIAPEASAAARFAAGG